MENTQTTNDQVSSPETAAAPAPAAVPAAPAVAPAPVAEVPSGGSSALPIISLILGIISLIFSLFLITGLVGGAVAIVLGIMGLKSKGRGMAIAGLVTGILGILGYLGFYFMRQAAGL